MCSNIKYKIFDKENNELTLDSCENNIIYEIYPINYNQEENICLDFYFKILKEKNYNIYEAESDFYNDKCTIDFLYLIKI